MNRIRPFYWLLFPLTIFCTQCAKKELTGEFVTKGVHLKFTKERALDYDWHIDVTVSHKGGIVSTGVSAPAFLVGTMKEWESRSLKIDASTVQMIQSPPDQKGQTIAVDFQSYFVVKMEKDKMEYDKEASQIEGRAIKIIMDENGDLKDCLGLEDIPYVRKTVVNINEVLLLTYAMAFQPFPTRLLKIGDSWERTFFVPLETKYADTKLNMRVKYTLTGFEMKKGHKCAVIRTEVFAQIQKGPRVKSPVLISGSGKGKGKIYFDFEEGTLVFQADKLKTQFNIEGVKEAQLKGRSIIYVDYERKIELKG